MKQKEYNLNFYEALKEVIENKACVKGNRFTDGIFLRLGHGQYVKQLVLVDAGRLYIEEPFILYEGIETQMFRIVYVQTMKELMQ